MDLSMQEYHTIVDALTILRREANVTVETEPDQWAESVIVHHRTGRSDECPTVCTLTTVCGDSTTNSFWLLRISGTLC